MTSAELLLDTSAALARVDPDHVFHRAVNVATHAAVVGLAGHAQFETYSVLTRLPAPKRVDPATARRIIEVEFPHPAHLSSGAAARLLAEFAQRGVSGGAVYDGLVAAAALEVDRLLLSCDARAAITYRAVGVRFELVS